MLNFCTGSGIGSSNNANIALETTVTLVPGKNIIDLLSVTVGLQVVTVHAIFVRFINCIYFTDMIGSRTPTKKDLDTVNIVLELLLAYEPNL